jgi:hypothetical protein
MSSRIMIKKPKFQKREKVFYHQVNGITKEVVIEAAFYDFEWGEWKYKCFGDASELHRESNLERINGERLDLLDCLDCLDYLSKRAEKRLI